MEYDNDFSKKTDLLIKGIPSSLLKSKFGETLEWSDLVQKAGGLYNGSKKLRINWFKIVYGDNGILILIFNFFFLHLYFR